MFVRDEPEPNQLILNQIDVNRFPSTQEYQMIFRKSNMTVENLLLIKDDSVSIDEKIYFDLVTVFKLLSLRLDCIEHDSDFVRKETKRTFLNLVARLNNSNKTKDLLLLYQYLLGHIWLFKLNYLIPVNFTRTHTFTISTNNDDRPSPDQPIIIEIQSAIAKFIPCISQILDTLTINSANEFFIDSSIC